MENEITETFVVKSERMKITVRNFAFIVWCLVIATFGGATFLYLLRQAIEQFRLIIQ